MATHTQVLIGTNAHNLFQVGWIDPEKVALHSEGTATYTLVPPHSDQGTELVVLPLGPDRLLSVGARVYRGFDDAIAQEGVELYEIRLCRWQPGCKEVFLPPGTASIHPVVLGEGDSWTARVPITSDGRHLQGDITVSVTDREEHSFTVKVEIALGAEDGFALFDVGLPGVCGLRASGTPVCWGWSGAQDVPEGPFTSIGLGFFACATRAIDAGVECWGEFYEGTPPPDGEFGSVSVMRHHACGLRTDGALACWGSYPESEPVVDPPDGTFLSVSAGLSHACGIGSDRAVQCWGSIDSGEAFSTPPTGEFTSVSSGANFSCGLRTDQSVTCWSMISGLTTWEPPPGQYTFLAAGWNNSCAIGTNGAVVCWGHDRWFDFTPPDGVFTAVSVEYDGACGLRLNNTVECWGGQRSG